MYGVWTLVDEVEEIEIPEVSGFSKMFIEEGLDRGVEREERREEIGEGRERMRSQDIEHYLLQRQSEHTYLIGDRDIRIG